MTDNLPQTVRQTRERLLELLADLDPAAVAWVDAQRAARQAKPSVVVVGETNRGKSSLVNALLATPNASPVDADVATSSYLVFGHADTWQASAHYPGSIPPVPFDMAELPNWVTMRGELPIGALPPRFVTVDGPVPLLDRLTIVDTPGVGGLNSVHGELAKEAARDATALLFVVDASSPFTSGELAFLAEVGERVETVLFALTKVDAFRGWREILDADRALLAEHAPRFARATFHPCSARMFELAGTSANEQAAAMLRERSGIVELQVSMQELLIGRSVMLAEANGLRTVATALTEQEAGLAAQVRALDSGAEEAANLTRRRDELVTARRSATRGWQVRLRAEMQRARMETGHEVSREMRDLQSWFRQAIDAADRATLADAPRQVDTALQLASGRISVTLAQRLGRVADTVLAELFSAEELAVLRAHFVRGGPPVVLRAPERRAPSADDKLLVFMGITGGFGAARVAALPLGVIGIAALNPFVLPATIVIGLGAGWWLARTRKYAAEKQQMKQWLTEAIADARATLDQLVSEQLIEAEAALSLALDEALGKRIDTIEAELRELDRTMKLQAGERAKELARANAALAEVHAGQARAAQLLEQIRVLRDHH
ncbi:MAG TPA: dynamin family protein [Pseudonocardiaceae bacterium]|nr:dynamin family protein [Pseudonocardiaceae bacterium]